MDETKPNRIVQAVSLLLKRDYQGKSCLVVIVANLSSMMRKYAERFCGEEIAADMDYVIIDIPHPENAVHCVDTMKKVGLRAFSWDGQTISADNSSGAWVADAIESYSL